ncbi:2'-5' RNA ligase family protein [Ornithinimicrobium sp. INDO-MA30-4]|uniref:2'-5' RNA ligase family protein n=1 Tax=Ornithinimicrobium sp. INDO-MA30-4 TaxID=2908651 RepID=UPI0037CC6996
MTNAPHVTVVAAQDIPNESVDLARNKLALPAELTVRGLVLFGDGPRVTIAHLVEPDHEFAALVAEIHRGVPANRYPVWTPHITLARRVPRAKVAEALDVLSAGEPLGTITATRLRWWDPVQRSSKTWPSRLSPRAGRATQPGSGQSRGLQHRPTHLVRHIPRPRRLP